jgi:hypothetical protein
MNDWEFLINFTWPHEGIKVGFDIFPSDEEEGIYYNEVRLYFFLVNFIFIWE